MHFSSARHQERPKVCPVCCTLVFAEVFTFSQDTEIVEESFLEDVANMLSSGEVPNLFTGDELSTVRASLEKAGKDWKM